MCVESRDIHSMLSSISFSVAFYGIIPAFRRDYVMLALVRLVNFVYLLLRVHFIWPLATATDDNQTNARVAQTKKKLALQMNEKDGMIQTQAGKRYDKTNKRRDFVLKKMNHFYL